MSSPPARLGALVVLLAWLVPVSGAAADGQAPTEAPQAPPPQWIGVTGVTGKAILTWIPNQAFASIRIFRRVPTEGSLSQVGETTANTFTDSTVAPGGQYFYRLVGVDRQGRESRPSAEAGVRIPGVERRPATPPRWEGGLMLENGIGLKWMGKQEEDVLAINIYRRSSGEAEYQLIGSSRGTSFLDQGVDPGQEYVYALTALDSSFRETAFSDPLPLRFTPPAAKPEKGKETRWRLRRTRLVKVITSAESPLLRPTDVAIGPVTGRVFLSESGTNRISVFDRAGTWIRTVRDVSGAEIPFVNLLGIALDGDENVYAVDAGKGAVVQIGHDGTVLRRVDVSRAFSQARSGIIDVAVRPDRSLYIVDNLNHRVLLFGEAGLARHFGGLGAEPGSFSAPTFCTLDPAGRLLVSDALNGRVQVFDPSGEFSRSIGRYGQGPGALARPKGLAVSPAGETYVADSWLNVIQVFDPSGAFVAALGDEEGRALDLGSPNGIALDRSGRIWIAERLANRLQVRELIDGR